MASSPFESEARSRQRGEPLQLTRTSVINQLTRELFDAEFEICAALNFNLNQYFLAYFNRDLPDSQSSLPLAYIDRALHELHRKRKKDYSISSDSVNAVYNWFRQTAGKWALDTYARPLLVSIHPAVVAAACIYLTQRVFVEY